MANTALELCRHLRVILSGGQLDHATVWRHRPWTLAERCKEVELALLGGQFDEACLRVDSVREEHRRVLQALNAGALAA